MISLFVCSVCTYNEYLLHNPLPFFLSVHSLHLVQVEETSNRVHITVGVNKNWTLVIVNFSAQDASILKIQLQEEVLRIPKHPQHAKFA